MKIFVTGATGYIGSAVVERLRNYGHQVLGLARSDAAAQKLEAAGVESTRGELRDTTALTHAARDCDASIHLAMEFSAAASQLDRSVVETILEEYRLSGRLFLYTSGIWVVGDTAGVEATEESALSPTPFVAWRPAVEQLVLKTPGPRGVVIRPAMVYGRNGGFVAGFAKQAREQGVVQIVGDGGNRWPFVHVEDLADLYVLALGAAPGSLYFASAGESIPVRDVARAAAKGAPVESIPLDEARKTMGPIADALVLDQLISSQKAIRELGWSPVAKSVIEELSVSSD